jgi:hypothetical protein
VAPSEEIIVEPNHPSKDRAPSPYALLVTPGFYFSKLSATDVNQYQANLASGVNPSLEASFQMRWAPEWRTRINVGGAYTSLSTSSATDALLNSNQFLWNLSLDITRYLSENVSFTISPGISQQLFVDRTSFYTLGVETMAIPDVMGLLHWGIFHSKDWDVGPDLGIGVLFGGSSSDGLTANTGALYRVAISGEKLGGDHPYGFSIYFQEQNQDTSVSSSSGAQLGLSFTFGFGFGGSASRSDK